MEYEGGADMRDRSVYVADCAGMVSSHPRRGRATRPGRTRRAGRVAASWRTAARVSLSGPQPGAQVGRTARVLPWFDRSAPVCTGGYTEPARGTGPPGDQAPRISDDRPPDPGTSPDRSPRSTFIERRS